jgi:uncharacterized protein
MSNAVFIDTSFFKALIDRQDEFHDQAKKIWQNLEQTNASLVCSNYIVDETATLIRAKIGLETAFKFRQLLINSRKIKICRVLIEDEASAWEWFKNDWSRLSFTDCVTFAQMKRLKIERVCSFDRHFERAGFGSKLKFKS